MYGLLYEMYLLVCECVCVCVGGCMHMCTCACVYVYVCVCVYVYCAYSLKEPRLDHMSRSPALQKMGLAVLDWISLYAPICFRYKIQYRGPVTRQGIPTANPGKGLLKGPSNSLCSQVLFYTMDLLEKCFKLFLLIHNTCRC